MDDEAYETNLRVFQRARTTAVLTASITAFITFVAFMIAGFDIQVNAATRLIDSPRVAKGRASHK
ncbi:hypothetical protein, partial [Brevibacterium aurantiacum]|uniref:hypothetical protein n=1 Tax=Brevibacterium aurantiacum TaxID=273384 RepID=UPI001D025638